MNVMSFLQNIRLVANAPGGMKQIRHAIRQLAIRGTLVEQRLTEPDATTLLEQIESHHASIARADRRSARSSTFGQAPLPQYAVPPSWVWAFFGELVLNRDGERVPVSKEQRTTRTKQFDYYGASGVIDKIDTYLFDKPLLLIGEDGANLLNRSTPIAFIARGKYWVNNHAHVLDGISEDLLRYLELYVNAIDLEPFVTGTAQPKMNQAKMNSIPVALPPLEEQKRIVAKVDELMRLCDRLEAQQQEREKLLPLLSRANHTRFVAEPTPTTLRTVFGQSHSLSPDDLRGTVLQLAVMGRLVPRIESEGDTDSLIATIYQKRQQQADENGSRLSSLLPDVDPQSQVLAIPTHWRWIRLGNLASKIGSGSTPRGGAKVYVASGVPFLRSQNIWNDGIRLDDVAYIAADTHHKMRSTHVSPHDILLNITGASLGRCAKVPSDFETANVSQHVTIIRPLLSETRHFLHICLLSPFGQGMIWDRQVGMAREGLSKKVLEQFEIPLPPLDEQVRIVQKVEYLLSLVDRLSERKSTSAETARLFAIEAVAAITSTEFTENERMKPPKTEVVTALKVGTKPKNAALAPLAALLAAETSLAPPISGSSADAIRELTAKELWQLSGLEIDAFYRQLKTEMTNGWIEEDEDKRAVKEVEAR